MNNLGLVLMILVGVLVLAAVVFSWRIRALTRRVGSFDCRLPIGDASPDRVKAGIAHYGVGRIDWWRFWSLSLRPAKTWRRDQLEIVSREEVILPGRPGTYLVHCRYADKDLKLQMSIAAYAGLTSWLEAAPPRPHGHAY